MSRDRRRQRFKALESGESVSVTSVLESFSEASADYEHTTRYS